jgi:acetyl esterase/lipase
VYIHGGGWINGTYKRTPSNLEPLLQEGIAVASVAYRLSQQAIFPAHIHDVKGAVRFLRAHAGRFGLDPLRIGVYGGSAGGHLTALLAVSGGVDELEGTTGGNTDQSSRVLVAADLFGPTDLFNFQPDYTDPPGFRTNHDVHTSPESRIIGFDKPGEGIGVLRENINNPAPPFPEKVRLARLFSPLEYVDAGDPVMIIAHGEQDNVVAIRQSERLAEKLLAAQVPYVFLRVSDRGHQNLGPVANTAIVRMLVDELKRPMGDATRDGVVDTDDLSLAARHYLDTAPKGWRQGDFNADGRCDRRDIELLRAGYADAGHTNFDTKWNKALKTPAGEQK